MKKHFQKGFTFIELMTILFIIGIAAGAVTIAIGDNNRPTEVRYAVKNLYNGMKMALEEAVFTQKQLGIRFDIDKSNEEMRYQYNWLEYRKSEKGNEWVVLEDEFFETQYLPVGLELELNIEGQSLVIGAERDDDEALFENIEIESESMLEKFNNRKKSKPRYPDLYFMSSGETLDFEVIIRDETREDVEYKIKGNLLGQLEWIKPDDE